jgi:hypothetical protein
MRLVRTLVISSLAAVVLALAAAPAGAQSIPTLTDVRAGGHTGFDRVVFEFRGAVPEHRVGYVDQLVQDGSGQPVSVAGAADLEVVFHGANAHTQDGTPTISPRRFPTGLTAVREVAQIGDFEAVVSYGIGVDRLPQHRAGPHRPRPAGHRGRRAGPGPPHPDRIGRRRGTGGLRRPPGAAALHRAAAPICTRPNPSEAVQTARKVR